LGPAASGKEIDSKAAFLWQKFPKFVLGFIVISALATAGGFTKTQVTDLANLLRWAFLLTFAGVGLRTNVRDLMKEGWRPLMVWCGGRMRDRGSDARDDSRGRAEILAVV
jgi:uncharacterized membrane protein YadS